MEEEKNILVNTDMGLISRDNANWLYSVGVLTYNGFINGKSVEGISEKRVLLYSYLRIILDDIKNSVPTLPNKVYLSLDDLLTLARAGVLEKKYEDEGIEYVYKATYPMVFDIERDGKRVFVANLPKKKASFSEEDL